MAVVDAPPVVWYGSAANHRESASVAGAMLVVTVGYEAASSLFPGYAFSSAEFLGTWTGLTCVWLTRTQNILCWPWGIVSVLALGWFFREIGLPGQEWLNWGFFLLIQLWAWPYWALGGRNRSELPVTFLSAGERAGIVLAILVSTYGIYRLIDYFTQAARYPVLDALVVSASVAAQFLLGRKKVESWLLWFGPVNLMSIFLFFLSGAYTLTALYLAFLVHAGFAIRSWARAGQ